MARHAFGRWGAGLDRDEFACALAATGLPGRGASELAELALAFSDHGLPWHLTGIPDPSEVDARAASRAWRALLADPPRPLRVAVGAWPPELRTPTWLLEELARPAVGFDAVFLDAPGRRSSHRWSWPLQIAILDDGRSEVREQLSGDPPWLVTQLTELVEAESPEPCDLLIVPAALRAAVARILPAPIKATAVVLLGRLDEPWSKAHALVDTLLMDTEAGAIVFAQTRDRPAAWLDAVLETLAHDQGLDVALLAAARRLELPAPLVIAERRLLDETRLSRVQERMHSRMRGEVAMANGGGAALEAMADEVGSAPSFEHESHGASVLADVSRRSRELRPPAQPRFLQARVLEHTADGDTVPARALRPTALHEVVVRIGPSDAEWLADTTGFPEEELPPAEEHRLTVVLTEPRLLDEPQTAEIVLRPTGPSTQCSFWLQAPRAEGPLEARVIVLHEGRVLQTGLLVGEIAEGAIDDERALRLTIEAVVHPASDLDGRTRFDAAFVLNHDREDVARVTTVAGEHVDIREPQDMREALETIRARLEDAVTAEGENELDSESTEALLVFLARQGSLLYQALLDLNAGPVAAWERVQVVSLQPEAFLPLEFVYDRTPPSLTASLCPNAKQALETGRCDDCPALGSNAFVCPLGFWCLSKVIERQLHRRNGIEGVEGDYRVQSAPTSTRRTLGTLGSALFAASKRVDEFHAGTIDEVAAALETATGTAAARAETWPKWAECIETSSPPLLVVLPHTVQDESSISALEIEAGASNEERLAVVDIGTAYVGDTAPIVVLLGCKTGDPRIAFQQFPAAFRRSGAAIVVATLTKVLGRYAGPVAGRLVAALATSSHDRRVTFGEVMRDARRALMAEGVPTVLAITAYGDADWMLGPGDGG